MAETANMQSPEMRYLLGTLSEDEKIRLEEGFFADDSQFEAVEIAEDALIDAYVGDELSTEERQQFQRRLRTSPRLVERVYFAQALAERTPKLVAPEHAPKVLPVIPSPPANARWWERWVNLQPAPRLAFAACALLLVAGSVALITSLVRLRGESNRIAAERAALQRQNDDLVKQLSEQRARSEQLAAEFQRLQEQRIEDLKLQAQQANKQKEPEERQPFVSTIATVLLTAGALRSDGDQRELVIQPETITAQLTLDLDKNDYPTYNAVVTNVGGTFVTRKDDLRPHNKSHPQLLLSIPARLLPPNSYRIKVDGVTATGQVEEFTDYEFRVTKK